MDTEKLVSEAYRFAGYEYAGRRRRLDLSYFNNAGRVYRKAYRAYSGKNSGGSEAVKMLFGIYREAAEKAKASLRAIKSVLPSLTGGVLEPSCPYICETASAYLSACGNEICESGIKTFFSALAEKKNITDADLSVLGDALALGIFRRLSEEAAAADGGFGGQSEDRAKALVLSLRRLERTPFGEIFRVLSPTEKVLMSEKAGVYALCDDRTKNAVRYLLERRAKHLKTDVLTVAAAYVAAADERGTDVCRLLFRRIRYMPALWFYSVFSVTFFALYFLGKVSGVGAYCLVMMPFAALAAYDLAKQITTPFFEKMQVRGAVPSLAPDKLPEIKTLVSTVSILTGEKNDAALFDRLEDFKLTNDRPGVTFAILGDLKESAYKKSDEDEAIVSYAKERVDSLNAKYGGGFLLLVRERRYSQSENKYICWERKRGGVLELMRYTRGMDTSLRLVSGDIARDGSIKYLITLDGDTVLYSGAVADMLRAAAHPSNRPVLDEKSRVVVSGYGIMQPRMATSLDSAGKTRFSVLTVGSGGVDAYSGAAFDLYQSVFREAVFCGKGIIDIDCFLTAAGDFFPEERILSHDLLEGNLCRCALLDNVVLTDGTPSTPAAYYRREHRWIRGDAQAARYCAGKVEGKSGAIVRNPMNALSRFKLADNVLRALTPLASVLLIAVSAIFGHGAAVAAGILVLLNASYRLVYILLSSAVKGNIKSAARRFNSVTVPHIVNTFLSVLFKLSSMAYEGWLAADAVIRSFYRIMFSGRKTLDWVTAQQAEKGGDGLLYYLKKTLPSTAFGIGFLFIPYGYIRLLGAFFIMFPFICAASTVKIKREKRISEKAISELTGYARASWEFFADNVTRLTNHLPPDNVQFFPVESTAMRTSPTNIGLYLVSTLAARDFGFITSSEMFDRIADTLKTVGGLQKWHGHLYNWYDVCSLSVIGGSFVSTVDSGNFVCSLVAVEEGMKEYIADDRRAADLIRTCEALRRGTDFTALYSRDRGLLRIGYDAVNCRYTESCYDILMSEARLTCYYASASGQLPPSSFSALSRRLLSDGGYIGAGSWSGTAFEYFMPQLFLPAKRGSLISESLAFAARMQMSAPALIRSDKRYSAFGVSESGYYHFDSDMNYQYKAFGIAGLSVSSGRNDRVVSPYSSFLMLSCGADRMLTNLNTLKKAGAYGKYGFYEAVDAEPSRVRRGYAVISSYMAHHVGMTVIASANACFAGIMQKRFMRNSAMRASRGLLCERIPISAPVSGKRRRVPEKRPYYSENPGDAVRISADNVCAPTVTLLSNGKTALWASSLGHITLYSGRIAESFPCRDRYSFKHTFFVFVKIRGEVFSATPAGDVSRSGEYEFQYDRTKIMYISRHSASFGQVTVVLTVALSPNGEYTAFNCRIRSSEKTAAVELSFLPVMDTAEAFEVHPAFSGLGISASYDAEERVLVYSRRASDGRGKGYSLAVKSSVPFRFDTRRSGVLPPGYSVNDVYENAFSECRCDTGAAVNPYCRIVTNDFPLRNKGINFVLGRAGEKEDAVYGVSSVCDDPDVCQVFAREMRRLTKLRSEVAGLPEMPSRYEAILIRNIYFGISAGARRAELSANDRFSINSLWRLGISGDFPIVIAELDSPDDAEQKKRLASVIATFGIMCVQGVRYDLIILYDEKDGYYKPVEKLIKETAKGKGCEYFLGASCGIHPIEKRRISREEYSALRRISALCDELFRSRDTVLMTESTVPLLPAELIVKSGGGGALLPDGRTDVIENGLCGRYLENGFEVFRKKEPAVASNIICSRNFGTLVTQFSLGYTWLFNSRTGTLTAPADDVVSPDFGESIILRVYGDEPCDHDLCAVSSNVVFSPGCAEYYGTADGIGYRVTVTVDPKLFVKSIYAEIDADTKWREAKLFYTVRPCRSTDKKALSSALSVCDVGRVRNTAFVTPLLKNGYEGFSLFVSAPSETRKAEFYTDKAAFLSDGKTVSGENDAVCIFKRISMSSKNTFACIFGAARNMEYFNFICEKYSRSPAETTEENRRYAAGFLKGLSEKINLRSKDRLFDAAVNRYFLYQTYASRLFARTGFYQTGGAYGFRDQLQDVCALISEAPDIAKRQIYRAAAHQFYEGDAMHWWHTSPDAQAGTGVRTRCSDDMLWLPYAVIRYVGVTGDLSILSDEIRYLSSPVLSPGERDRYHVPSKSSRKESVYMHCARAIDASFGRGAHSLPLIGSGDWNDSFSRVGIKGRGESVWLAFFLASVLRDFAPIAGMTGDREREKRYRENSKMLLEAARRTFNGEYYLRGYYDSGRPLCDLGCECECDAISQAWAAMTLKGDEPKKAVLSAYGRLYDRDARIYRLLWPPFPEKRSASADSPGYITGYCEGARENGGQYTHAAIWAACGLISVGENRLGAEVLKSLCPPLRLREKRFAESYYGEPYVIPADIFSSPGNVGRCGWTWYTGSAAWYRRAVIEYLCGYRETTQGGVNGFCLRPALSQEFEGFSLKIAKNGTEYDITVSGGEQSAAFLDGDECGTDRFFIFDGKKHRLDMTLCGGIRQSGKHIMKYDAKKAK